MQTYVNLSSDKHLYFNPRDKHNINQILIPVDHSINNDLNRILVSQQVDNLHSMLNNADCHQLLAIVSPVHHQRVSKPLHNWALGLPKPLV